VSGIALRDVESAKRVLGDHFRRIREFDVTSWGVELANQDRTEHLQAVQYPGTERGSFSQFTVSLKSSSDLSILAVPSFTSSCGIHLGMTESNVVAILGEALRMSTEAGRRTLHYRAGSDEEFVEAARMPGYFAVYTFEEERLTQFDFGFDRP
jgi:hypothetical protein